MDLRFHCADRSAELDRGGLGFSWREGEPAAEHVDPELPEQLLRLVLVDPHGLQLIGWRFSDIRSVA
jgi:hypothetical protein